MKKTFEFTEQEAELLRKEQYKYLINDNIDHFLLLVQQIVSERITHEQDTIKPYHEHGNSVASDRTESGQSAEDYLVSNGLQVIGNYMFSMVDVAKMLTTYASQVCADKEYHISELNRVLDIGKNTISELRSELDKANESLTVMIRKNAELEKELEFKRLA